jgi:hypothetical protein
VTPWINDGSKWSIYFGNLTVNVYPPRADSRGKHYGYVADDGMGSGRFSLDFDLNKSKAMMLEIVRSNAVGASEDALEIARLAEAANLEDAKAIVLSEARRGACERGEMVTTSEWREEQDEVAHGRRRLTCEAGSYVLSVWKRAEAPSAGYVGEFCHLEDEDGNAEYIGRKTFKLGNNLKVAKETLNAAARSDALRRRDAAMADYDALKRAK